MKNPKRGLKETDRKSKKKRGGREITHVDFIWVTIEMAEDRSPKSTKWKRVAEKRRETEREKRKEGRELPFWVQLSDEALIGFGFGSTKALIFFYEIHFTSVERENP